MSDAAGGSGACHDSRFWGPIKGTSIIGTAVLLFWRIGRPDFHPF